MGITKDFYRYKKNTPKNLGVSNYRLHKIIYLFIFS